MMLQEHINNGGLDCCKNATAMMGPTHHPDPVLHWLCWAQNAPFCPLSLSFRLHVFYAFFFYFLLHRPPSLLLLPPLLHSLMVSFCTHSLLDHCITSWFLFIFLWSFDYCLSQSEVVGNTSAKIHHGEPSTLIFFFCRCCLWTSRVQMMRMGCNFEHTSSCWTLAATRTFRSITELEALLAVVGLPIKLRSITALEALLAIVAHLIKHCILLPQICFQCN
jgi:hypothetical protein